MKIHIVQKGDTLWKLSKKYGVSFEELKKINSQLSNPDMMMPGMKIKIPGTSGTVKKQTGQPQVHYSAKEHPVQPQQQPMAKEVPMAPPPQQKPAAQPYPIAKEMPIQQPKEKVVIKEKPIVKEVPKPVLPEVDINNYYMVNMANMSVAQTPKEQPKIPEPPKAEAVQQPPAAKPVPLPMPISQEPDCIPVTPIMPGSGFKCPPPPWACAGPAHGSFPSAPMPQPQVQGMFSPPMMGNVAGMQWQGTEESADCWNESSSDMFPSAHAQGAAGGFPTMPMHPYQMPVPGQHPYQSPTQQSAGGMFNQQTYEYMEESSSYQMPGHFQQPHSYVQPSFQQEEDCGCGSPIVGTYGPEVKGQFMPGAPMTEGKPAHGSHPSHHHHEQAFIIKQQNFAPGAFPHSGGTDFGGHEKTEHHHVMGMQHGMNSDSMSGPFMQGNMPDMGHGHHMQGNMPDMGHGHHMQGNMPDMGHGHHMQGNMPDMGHGHHMQGNMPDMGHGHHMQGNMPGMGHGHMQGSMPGMMPGQMQGGMPGMMPGQMQGGMPGMMPGQMQGGMPGMMPGQMQGGMPGMMPGQMQGGMPRMMPGPMPGMPGAFMPDQFGGIRAPEAFGMPTIVDESNDY
nr:SafA/ExsA family spore coat assembly protein [Bacillus massiliglaciei]